MAKVKVFISGPITGYEDNNRAKFYEAERTLRGLGFDVFNPVWMDFTDSWAHEEIMSVDLAALATCDAIYQLEGWEHSKGALKEFYFAIDHNKDFVTYESLLAGADFDGDTVMVIPTKKMKNDMKFLYKSVRVGAPTGVAARMRDAYIARRGVRGGISNMVIGAPVRPLSFINLEHKEILQLLVDMTFKGASDEELERVIKYSKIVIDAEKDISIDWRKEAIGLGIQELKKKYMPFGVPTYGMSADSVTIDEVHELDPFGLNDKKETENEEN
jgi:hypothetical protein